MVGAIAPPKTTPMHAPRPDPFQEKNSLVLESELCCSPPQPSSPPPSVLSARKLFNRIRSSITSLQPIHVVYCTSIQYRVGTKERRRGGGIFQRKKRAQVCSYIPNRPLPLIPLFQRHHVCHNYSCGASAFIGLFDLIRRISTGYYCKKK